MKAKLIMPKCGAVWIAPIPAFNENIYVYINNSSFGAAADNSNVIHLAEFVQCINDFVVYALADYFCTPEWDRPCGRNTTYNDDVGAGGCRLPYRLAHGPHRPKTRAVVGVSICRNRIGV